jgi:PTS system nitrogen regulatory IIA component
MTRQTPYGSLLRKQRVQAGLSLRDVATRLGVSHVFLADVERGARNTLSPDHEPALMKLIPKISKKELDDARRLSKPIRITLDSTPEGSRPVTIALARRYEEGGLRETQVTKILEILEEKKK